MSKSFLLIDTPCDCDSCPYLDDVGYTCGAFQKSQKKSERSY